MVSNHLSAQYNQAPLISMNGLLKNSRQFHSNLSLNSNASSIYPRHCSLAAAKSPPDETSMDEAKMKKFRCCDFEIIKNAKKPKKVHRAISRSYLGSEEVLNYKLSFNKEFFKPNGTEMDITNARNVNGVSNSNGVNKINDKFSMGLAKYEQYF